MNKSLVRWRMSLSQCRLLKTSWLFVVVGLLHACSFVPAVNNGLTERVGNPVQQTTVDDSRTVKKLLNEALAAVAGQDYQQADKAFTDMLAAGARSPASLNHYAIYLREQWRIDEAEQVYQQALKYSPIDAMTHWNIAILYELYKGDYKQAVAHYQQYQQYASEPDKRVAAWIGDLQRRIAAGEGIGESQNVSQYTP